MVEAYENPDWNPTVTHHFKKLEVIERSCLRSILGLKANESSNKPLYNRLPVMPMNEVAEKRTEKFFKN